MTSNSIKFALLAFASSSAVALAAPTAWDMPSGDHGTYTYSMGQSANGNFGTGNTYSEGFYFTPPGLKASAFSTPEVPSFGISMNGHDEASDTVSIILNAKAGSTFSRISSGLLGDYSIFGVGSVDASAALRVTNLDTSITLSMPLDFTTTVPVSTETSANGIFDGGTSIDLPAGWTNIRVELDGLVSADAEEGTSFIQAKDSEISVQTANIPLPAAIFVAPVMAAVGYRARRKLGLVK